MNRLSRFAGGRVALRRRQSRSVPCDFAERCPILAWRGVRADIPELVVRRRRGARLDRLQGITATVALLGGFGLPVVGWLFFCQPGVSVWAACVPLWRASKYLTGTGVVLWLAGLPATTVGAVLILAATRCVPASILASAGRGPRSPRSR